MKTAKVYPSAFKWVFAPLIFGTAVIAVFFPNLIHFVFYLNTFYLVMGICFLVIPLKKVNQSQNAAAFSYLKTFIKISLLELFLVITALNLYIVFTKLMPATAVPAVDNVLINQLHHVIDWGLFPLSLIVLMGITLAYHRSTGYSDIGLKETTCLLFGKSMNPALGAGIELFLRQGLICWNSIVVLSIGLSIYFYATALGIPRIPFSPNGYTLLIYFLIFVLISSRYWSWLLQKLWQRNFSTLQLFWLQTLCSILFILILTPLISIVGENANVNLAQTFLFPLPKLSFNYAWELFMWSFWMATTAVMAPQFADIAKGKNLKILFVFGLFWPVILAGLGLAPSLQDFWHHLFALLNTPKITFGFNIFATVLLSLYFWFNKQFESLLFNSFYFKSGRKDARISIKIIAKILRLMSLVLLLYMFGGINLISLALFGMVSTCLAIYLGAGVALLKTLLLEKWRHRN